MFVFPRASWIGFEQNGAESIVQHPFCVPCLEMFPSTDVLQVFRTISENGKGSRNCSPQIDGRNSLFHPGDQSNLVRSKLPPRTHPSDNLSAVRILDFAEYQRQHALNHRCEASFCGKSIIFLAHKHEHHSSGDTQTRAKIGLKCQPHFGFQSRNWKKKNKCIYV